MDTNIKEARPALFYSISLGQLCIKWQVTVEKEQQRRLMESIMF